MRALVAAIAVACLWSANAVAAISVLGGGQAQACFQAAKTGRADEASLASCDQALDSEMLSAADRGGTLINRGVIKLRRADYEAAHADFDAGIGMIPKAGEGWVDRAAMFIGERRYREALADLNQALSLGLREPAKAYFDRAIAEEGMGDDTAAYLDYQQAQVLAPTWDLPRRELERFTVVRR